MRGWARTLGQRIDATLGGQSSARKRRRLFERLRSDSLARDDYDRAVEALRVLEERPIAGAELDLVEGWLFEEGIGAREPESRPWLRRLTMATAAVAGAAAFVILLPREPRIPADMQARAGSGRSSGLAIDILCGQADEPPGLQRAVETGCALGGTLSFAYRVDAPEGGPGYLSLFGISSDGDVLYYMPTPVDGQALAVEQGPWTPLPLAIALHVNHAPGWTRVYALRSPQPITVEHIDEAATALRDQASAQIGDSAWIERLGNTFIARMCEREGVCGAAEVAFEIHEDLP